MSRLFAHLSIDASRPNLFVQVDIDRRTLAVEFVAIVSTNFRFSSAFYLLVTRTFSWSLSLLLLFYDHHRCEQHNDENRCTRLFDLNGICMWYRPEIDTRQRLLWQICQTHYRRSVCHRRMCPRSILSRESTRRLTNERILIDDRMLPFSSTNHKRYLQSYSSSTTTLITSAVFHCWRRVMRGQQARTRTRTTSQFHLFVFVCRSTTTTRLVLARSTVQLWEGNKSKTRWVNK
jgi:hypothetical protein